MDDSIRGLEFFRLEPHTISIKGLQGDIFCVSVLLRLSHLLSILFIHL